MNSFHNNTTVIEHISKGCRNVLHCALPTEQLSDHMNVVSDPGFKDYGFEFLQFVYLLHIKYEWGGKWCLYIRDYDKKDILNIRARATKQTLFTNLCIKL